MEKKDKNYEGLVQAAGVIVFFILIYFWFNDRGRFFVYLGLVLFFFFIIAFAVYKVSKSRFERIYDKETDEEILASMRKMSPAEFEDNIEDIYNRLGYNTQIVGSSVGVGVDVIATKDGVKNYIQCKKHVNKDITLEDVRAFYDSIISESIENKGVIITTRKGHSDAEKFAQEKSLELLDSRKLIRLVRQAGETKGRVEIEKPKCGRCCGG